MNRTKIEWVKNPDGSQGYTWNPITGCLNGCPYCYARKLANGRLFRRYVANTNLVSHRYARVDAIKILDPFYPRFWEERLHDSGLLDDYGQVERGTQKGIFVCDMGELFGDWVPEEWQDQIFRIIDINNQHRFYLLTKQPQNLIKFSPFPENCWVGVTATDEISTWAASFWMIPDSIGIKATIKFLSIEPLLRSVDGSYAFPTLAKEVYLRRILGVFDWLIIGAMTGKKRQLIELNKQYPNLTLMPYGGIWTLQPKIEWVEEIVEAANKANIPIFLKDNLKPLIGNRIGTYQAIPSVVYQVKTDSGYKLRQEMPK